MSHFQFRKTPLEGLMIIERSPKCDSRGFFERMFCVNDLKAVLGSREIKQINHSMTRRKGTIRGLHLQESPFEELKLVSCVRGKVFDVAVDLRKNSSTYMQWYGELLTNDNYKTMMIPEGCAHGFQTVTDDCELIYLHTAFYSAQHETGVNATDPTIAIAWPLPATERSDRDVSLPPIDTTSS